jgi:hypothetical protein
MNILNKICVENAFRSLWTFPQLPVAAHNSSLNLIETLKEK